MIQRRIVNTGIAIAAWYTLILWSGFPHDGCSESGFYRIAHATFEKLAIDVREGKSTLEQIVLSKQFAGINKPIGRFKGYRSKMIRNKDNELDAVAFYPNIGWRYRHSLPEMILFLKTSKERFATFVITTDGTLSVHRDKTYDANHPPPDDIVR